MFTDGDIVRFRNPDSFRRKFDPMMEFLVGHIDVKVCTVIKNGRRVHYYRCGGHEITSNGTSAWPINTHLDYTKRNKVWQERWTEGVIIPSTARVIRHVRYEHLSIFVNIAACTGGHRMEWLSENPPPIPQSVIDSHRKYGNRLILEEEWVALKEGRALPKKEVKRLHSQLRVA